MSNDGSAVARPGEPGRRRSLRERLTFGLWRSRPLVSVVRLSGVIGVNSPFRPGLCLASMAPVLEQAFAPGRLAAVALIINSPGGSPVQSALLAERIRTLADEKKVPVLAFVEDVAASGGYWLACAADEVFVSAASIVGSIGVISAGFGFQDLIARFGIERRVHTAGDRKLLLDPFKPEDDDGVARLRAIQAEMHETFKAMVRARRGDRLRGPEDELFSGEFWTGRGAVDRGLADGIASLRPLVRTRFGETVRLQMLAPERGWLRRRRAAGVAADVVGDLAAVAEERLLWQRYGL